MKDSIKNQKNDPIPISHANKTPDNQNNSNIILNQNGIPCYNNINIYTGVEGIKSGDINLRQFIFNKVNSRKGINKSNNKSYQHIRSNSSAGQ